MLTQIKIKNKNKKINIFARLFTHANIFVFYQGFNIWGVAVNTDKGASFFKQTLGSKSTVTLEEAIFRSELAFKPANLQEHRQFWEEEILKQHPQKKTLLSWIEGVKIEEFLNSFTDSEFQGIKLHSHYPQSQVFPNYVPQEFETFVDDTVKEWVESGALRDWENLMNL